MTTPDKLIAFAYSSSYDGPEENCSGVGYAVPEHISQTGEICAASGTVLLESVLAEIETAMASYVCVCGTQFITFLYNSPEDLS